MRKPKKIKEPEKHSVWKQWPDKMLRPIPQIVPYPENPRTHPPAQIAMLADLMKRFGPDQPIVVDADDDGYILKGHGRREAAILAGFDVFPIVERTGLTEAEKIEMRISDNQVGLLSGWDQRIISMQVGALKDRGYDLKLLGFGDQQLVQFTTLPKPPDQFQSFDENIKTAFHCPCGCDFRWSGNPLAGADPEEVKKIAKKKPKGRGTK